MATVCLRGGRATASPEWAAAREGSSDKALITRIAAGDRSAMQALFGRYRVALYRWLLRLVDDDALAEDLLSEVFLDVWRQAASFKGRSSVSTWLLAIARYKALSARMPNWTRQPWPCTVRPLCPAYGRLFPTTRSTTQSRPMVALTSALQDRWVRTRALYSAHSAVGGLTGARISHESGPDGSRGRS
jgi:DNA-directed RNA polymerase specialized sigma24 family protein